MHQRTAVREPRMLAWPEKSSAPHAAERGPRGDRLVTPAPWAAGVGCRRRTGL
jgi:hypothetical protein